MVPKVNQETAMVPKVNQESAMVPKVNQEVTPGKWPNTMTSINVGWLSGTTSMMSRNTAARCGQARTQG